MSGCHPHPTGCITCGDVAVAMRVIAVGDGATQALCEDAGGSREPQDVSLLGRVSEGDVLLAHAGVALANLGPPPP